jgi:hypothetical protein
MTDLTPEEREAVEAAREWSRKFSDDVTDTYDRCYDALHAESDAVGFACGWHAATRALREENGRLREALADLVPLALTAMTEANSDGAGYDTDAELADARAALAPKEQR